MMPPPKANACLIALLFVGLLINQYRSRTPSMFDTKLSVSRQTWLTVAAFSVLWPLAISLNPFVLPLFRLRGDWGWIAALAPYCVGAFLLRSRFLITTFGTTFIGVLISRTMESAVRSDTYLSQIKDEILRIAFWLISGVLIGVYLDYWPKSCPRDIIQSDTQQDASAEASGSPPT